MELWNGMEQFSRVLAHDQCIGKTKHTSYKEVYWIRRRSFAVLNSSIGHMSGAVFAPELRVRTHGAPHEFSTA